MDAMNTSLLAQTEASNQAHEAVEKLQKQFNDQREDYQIELKAEFDAKNNALKRKLNLECTKLSRENKRLEKEISSQSKFNEQKVQLDKYKAIEKQLRTAFTTILISEQEQEPQFSCFKCLAIYDSPVTCVPCGHHYCRNCLKETNNNCIQCSKTPRSESKRRKADGEGSQWVRNKILEELSVKFVQNKQNLGVLRELLKSLGGPKGVKKVPNSAAELEKLQQIGDEQLTEPESARWEKETDASLPVSARKGPV